MSYHLYHYCDLFETDASPQNLGDFVSNGTFSLLEGGGVMSTLTCL